MLTENPEFIEVMSEQIEKTELSFDSETSVARHLTRAVTDSSVDLGLSDSQLISADGFIWSYSNHTGTWSRVEHDELITLAQLYDGLWTEEKKPRRVNISFARATNIARSTLRLHELQAKHFFESTKPGIACTNGFLKVTASGVEITEHDAEHRATVAYDFKVGEDEDEDPPMGWLRFLKEIFAEDDDQAEKMMVLQEFIGICLVGQATQYSQCLLFLGSGSNGKSVLCELIAELLFPEGTVTHISPRRWGNDYSVSGLKDSRVNIVSELPETNAVEQADMFKAVTSGDKVEARLPYQPPHIVHPRAGHVFCANEMIRTSDFSFGFFRRFKTLSFNRSFEDAPERKTKAEIMDSIAPERGAIIMWALQGAVRLIRNGRYTEVASHKVEMENWKQDSDSVYDFMRSCLSTTEPDSEKEYLKDLSSEFEKWAAETKRKGGMCNRTLAKRLKALGLTKDRDGYGTLFKGVRLLTNQEASSMN